MSLKAIAIAEGCFYIYLRYKAVDDQIRATPILNIFPMCLKKLKFDLIGSNT